MKNTREKGRLGEDIACEYLKKQGYYIKNRNYFKKWGELDIVAMKDNIVHFFEVKSAIIGGGVGGYRPEENVHDLKIKRLKRVIQSYLNENNALLDCEFKFHVLVVRVGGAEAKNVEMIENIIL